MNRLYTSTDNLTFIGAFFRDPFVCETEREKRGIFHQAKKSAKPFLVPENASKKQRFIAASGRKVCSLDKFLYWSGKTRYDIISATRNVSNAPKTHTYEASTYLSR
jgi:hypothetical protein